ncbi:hypothetical protein [Variovorax ginsengisoli]|uniref:Uncharacterized protein n=1 Tax=Variovorax ginsengisoli TaxID=363844 RepID=A0ABT8SBT8_9BURK|nr:hypothetical protein [Variovorax ginsengisoli]MDN8616292.1 hypothetical protein [Variovorax ginsengisoli]MDO1535462.1 hypothetical protein [Variovorax ginsengisoli]
MTNHAIMLSVLAMVAIPIGLAFFLLPRVLYIHALWKAWVPVTCCPTGEEIRSTVEKLPDLSTMATEEFRKAAS